MPASVRDPACTGTNAVRPPACIRHRSCIWDPTSLRGNMIFLRHPAQWGRRGGAQARGARVPKFAVTKSSRSESHLELGLQKRIWLKSFATACHSNWWLWRSNFELTELGRRISTAIVWTAAKLACIRKLQEGHVPQCPMPDDASDPAH